MKAIVSRRILLAAAIIALVWAGLVQASSQIDLPGPAGSGAFGTAVAVLPNGNFVVTDPTYSIPGGAAQVGAVYLYSPTGVLISALTGSTAFDSVGLNGITVIANGNYVIGSSAWHNGGANGAGAATWCNGSTGLSGTVTPANSLVGSTSSDAVGGSVIALPSGNYLIDTWNWTNGTATGAGAVTFGNGTTGVTGVISTANSLVGTSEGDGGDSESSDITILANGNYVAARVRWTESTGAVTWGSGATGATGVISATNSLVGTEPGDEVGGQGVTALTNGNYVVSSTWHEAGDGFDQLGAVTWGNGATGVKGAVSSANSVVGSTFGDDVGTHVTALTNGNYVVCSPYWTNGASASAGAATWGNGSKGIAGAVTAANSLVGAIAQNGVGSRGAVALTNGNYVVCSPGWSNGSAASIGAATWGNGATGIKGVVSAANSLTGSTNQDEVGSGGAVALTNGNYAVISPFWHNGGVSNAGAVTWGDGSAGIAGSVSSANSLVGSTPGDNVGESFNGRSPVTALTNGNYVVASPAWSNAGVAGAGAFTWGNGASGIAGAVSAANSMVGSQTGDQVSGNCVTALTNGNYVVSSPNWANGSAATAGAVTWSNGGAPLIGAVSAANSLVGSASSDQVGQGLNYVGLPGVIALTNGNYVVQSCNWSAAGGFGDATTWGSGPAGISGTVSAANSLLSNEGGDGGESLTPLDDGNYVLLCPFSSNYAVTLGPGATGIAGLISSNNSVLGADITERNPFAYDAVRAHLIVGLSPSNSVCIFSLVSPVNVTFNAATDIPITAASYSGEGDALNITLNFAPSPGTNLTVVHNTGSSFIAAPFGNLQNGATVNLTYDGITYPFVAWYYGGSSGRDLVLLWPETALAAWGGNFGGQLGNDDTTGKQQDAPVAVDQTGVLAGQTIVQVARGLNFSLALSSQGLVYAWGSNSFGQLGNNDASGATQYAPVAVNTTSGVSALFGKTVVAIAAGEEHSLALCSDGTVAAWGYNGTGQLGNNDSTGMLQRAPVAVSAASGASALFGKTVVAIAAGEAHSLALCSDGTVAAWGHNGYGELGNNDSSGAQQNAPVAVSTASGLSALAGETAAAISAGFDFSLALCSDGTVAAWGYDNRGQLGDNDPSFSRQVAPVAVNAASGVSALFGKTVTAISAGSNFSLALCSDGMVAAWGAGGLLGDATTTERMAPVAVSSASGVSALFGKTVSAISAGSNFSLALCSDGTVAAWGQDGFGVLGNNDGSGANQEAPVAVSSTGSVSVLAGVSVNWLSAGSSASHSVAIYGVTARLPTVTTSAATHLTATSAMLNAEINPNGFATTAQFQYGATNSYGSNASITLSPNDGGAAQNVSATISGLTPGATYHFNAAASNTTGSANGSDQTFTTIATAPSSLSYSASVAAYTKGAAITSNTPSHAGGAAASYSVSPALPAGLTLNTANGIIAGTPTAITAPETYTVTATNTGGSTTATLIITVNDAPPSALVYAANPAVYAIGAAVSNQPGNSGGAATSYTVTPALPTGLALSKGAGLISGIPTAISAKATYTVSAANASGSTSATLEITVTDAPPAAVAQTLQATTEAPLSITLSATEVIPEQTTYTVLTQPSHGVLSGTPPNLTYTSLPTYTGSESFTFQAQDAGGVSTAATVRIDVTPPISAAGYYYGHYVGLISGADPAHSGTVTIAAVGTGAFTGSISFGGATYALKGVYDSTGMDQTSIPLAGSSPLAISLQFGLPPGRDVIAGTIGALTLAAGNANFSAASPAPEAGIYTIKIPPDPTQTDGSKTPQGYGVGALVVTSSGAITFIGTLADGTKISRGTSLTRDGAWYFFAPLYAATGPLEGMIEGAIQFENAPNVSDLDGAVTWIHPGLTKMPYPKTAFYPGGFNVATHLYGATYNPKGSLVLTLNSKSNTFNAVGGSLASGALSEPATAGKAAATFPVTGAKSLSLTVTTTTGLIVGSFKESATSGASPVNAVIYQIGAPPSIVGSFTDQPKGGTNESGTVTLTSP